MPDETAAPSSPSEIAAVAPTEPAVVVPTPETPVVAAVAPSAPSAEPAPARLGRYTHAELIAMQGKRGRKPPEFYELFPRTDELAPAKAAKKAKATRQRRAPVEPQVSSAVIGEHTIDELLALIGTTGKKPVAYGILREVAQVFVAQGAVELPPPADPLVAAVLAAPPALRALISDLLASAKPRAKPGRKPAGA